MAEQRFEGDNSVVTLSPYEAFIVRRALRKFALTAVSLKQEETALDIVATMEAE